MDARVDFVVNLLKKNPIQNHRIRDLAREVNLSHWHFTHLFITEMKMSPSQFQRQIKYQTAKVLLETTFLTIKEVMVRVGINDKSHFCKDFKKLYGVSPQDYRRFYVHHSRQSTNLADK